MIVARDQIQSIKLSHGMSDLSDNGLPPGRLSQHPDWRYLLREIYHLYRFSSAGGSANIRSHQKEVRHRLSRVLNDDPPVNMLQASQKPVCAHLPRALDMGMAHSTASLSRAIERICAHLHWEYGYGKVPRGLCNKYAYSELMGPKGPVVSQELTLGLVLFAPGTTYPTHSHQDITESYFCLSGAISENDVGVYAPGSLILNPPEHPHRITTSDREPSLLAYAWVGPKERLANQKMVLSRQRPAD
jgi:dimethylpropiothetin dethiomethylase